MTPKEQQEFDAQQARDYRRAVVVVMPAVLVIWVLAVLWLSAFPN